MKLKDEHTSDKPSKKRVCLYEHQHHPKEKPKMKRLVFKIVKKIPSISNYQITTIFGAKDLVIPPLSKSNSHHTMGSYHLHVEYDDEDSQEVTPEEINSSNMKVSCCSHIEDNKDHSQSKYAKIWLKMS